MRYKTQRDLITGMWGIDRTGPTPQQYIEWAANTRVSAARARVWVAMARGQDPKALKRQHKQHRETLLKLYDREAQGVGYDYYRLRRQFGYEV